MMQDTGIGRIGIRTLSNTASNSCSAYLTNISISCIATRVLEVVSFSFQIDDVTSYVLCFGSFHYGRRSMQTLSVGIHRSSGKFSNQLFIGYHIHSAKPSGVRTSSL